MTEPAKDFGEKVLLYTPAGVCGNCLNGRHDICSSEKCKCRKRSHKHQPWWGIKLAPEVDDDTEQIDACVNALAGIDDPVEWVKGVRGFLTAQMIKASVFGCLCDGGIQCDYCRASSLLAQLGDKP